MKKTLILAILLMVVATLIVVGCAESRGSGYSTYGNVPPPQVSGGGGGCGVGAPALADNDAASSLIASDAL
ncbi:TPA: hypothetical protein HA246_00290 [Candidatus Woesearchaeota archaeon]|nr:hypothetical protein [Candidatus Woesearchaeota archaeon]